MSFETKSSEFHCSFPILTLESTLKENSLNLSTKINNLSKLDISPSFLNITMKDTVNSYENNDATSKSTKRV